VNGIRPRILATAERPGPKQTVTNPGWVVAASAHARRRPGAPTRGTGWVRPPGPPGCR